jgi:hypothetical protein
LTASILPYPSDPTLSKRQKMQRFAAQVQKPPLHIFGGGEKARKNVKINENGWVEKSQPHHR